MIDIHTHILPGMDDGARDLQEALSLLAMQWASGVDRMYLTPHFHPDRTDPAAFLSAREQAWRILSSALDPDSAANIRLGAEVRFCPQLLHLDLRQFTLGDSDYLLLELAGQSSPPYLLQTLQMLLEQGIIPVLAHVERYRFFRQEPTLLKQLADLGVLAQVSAGALFDRSDRHFSQACLQHRLAQLVASDTHRTTGRSPCMELLKMLPEEMQQLHHACAEAIWSNEMPPYIHAGTIKKTFIGYR